MNTSTRATARLIASLQAERAVLDRLRERLDGAVRKAPWAEEDPHLYLVAVTLDHFYSACESAFERIARELEGLPPAGARWHQDLLDAMAAEIPGIRPAVITGPTREDLRALLSFRRFMRHAYAASLDAARLLDLAETLERAWTGLGRELDVFAQTLLAASTRPQ